MELMKNPLTYIIIGVVILAIILVGYFQLSDSNIKMTEETEEVIEGCGAGTVIYGYDDLCWQKNSKSAVKDWQTANSYCENLVLGDRDDWRLPTADELKSIIDESYEPAVNPKYFSNTEPSQYWSSSLYKEGMHWYIHFKLGYQGFAQDFIENYNVKCVRDSTLF